MQSALILVVIAACHICCQFLNLVLDFAVELLFLTKCDRFLLSTESTGTSLIMSLVPDKPTEYIGAMQSAAHLHLLLGTHGEHVVFRGQQEVSKL